MVVFFHGFRYLVHKPSSFIVVRTAYKVVSTPAAIRSARIVRAPANPRWSSKYFFTKAAMDSRLPLEVDAAAGFVFLRRHE